MGAARPVERLASGRACDGMGVGHGERVELVLLGVVLRRRLRGVAQQPLALGSRSRGRAGSRPMRTIDAESFLYRVAGDQARLGPPDPGPRRGARSRLHRDGTDGYACFSGPRGS